MFQKQFAENVVQILATEASVLGLAAGGSWISDTLDAFSDLDLVVVTKEKITDNKADMIHIAQKLGDYLSGFTGEHVGEPRLLICMYDNPLLHVDLKFVTPEEFKDRVENPIILLDKEGILQQIIKTTNPEFPYPDYQWIEDRFWTWIHYALAKVGRQEYLEALDFLAYLRMNVLGPLLHIKNNKLPRGVRKVEFELARKDFKTLTSTIPTYDKTSILNSLENAVELYRSLRELLFINVTYQNKLEEKVMLYFDTI